MLNNTNWDLEKKVETLEPWQKCLLNAADYISENGWCKGAGYYGMQSCAIGGILRITNEPIMIEYCKRRLIRFLGLLDDKVGPPRLHPIAEWNDAPERTKEEVISALRNCALSAAKDGRE